MPRSAMERAVAMSAVAEPMITFCCGNMPIRQPR
jgi:hypothetical protein